jgi:Tfp pilus assembly protein PilV
VNRLFKKAFTLIEVNLAIFIMAGGVLAMISLYSLGFRESRQSREDVASAALADSVLNPLVVALSSRDLTWSQWKSLPFKTLDSGTDAGDGSE